MSASDPKWTPQQKAAVEHVDGALLVSAAAGSGKTAVLAARCAYLVCDAPVPCDVDELLVLTFTRAAAAEMKERIDAAIRRRAAAPDASERILRQLRLIDRASITTIDAFCGQLVREYFHLVGVDPAFAMLAPEDASLLRNDVAADLIDAEFDAPDALTFRTLLDGYFGSDVDRLQRQIISAHALSQSIVDPTAWIDRSSARLAAGATSMRSELMLEFSQVQQRALRSAVTRLEQISSRAQARPGLEKYVEHVHALLTEFREWLVLAEAGDVDRLALLVSQFKSPVLPRVPKETPGKEAVHAEINGVKRRLSHGDLHKLLRWTGAQLQGDLRNLLPLAERFFDLVRRFTEAYDRRKRSLRTLDFADVESLALRILSSERNNDREARPSPTAYTLQAHYKHVLVDEFQDINPLQYTLLRLVSRDRTAELSADARSNLFSVGDVKQSIYRFRLAEPQQFIDRRAALGTPHATLGRVIDLQENFRSRAPLLEAINDVFRRLMTARSTGVEYDETHELKWLADYAPVTTPFLSGKPIELHVLPRDLPSFDDDEEPGDVAETDSFEREVGFVAKRIRALIEVEKPNVTVKGEAGPLVRPARYGDVVVLLRSAKFKSSTVADALRALGMPVHSDDATGFFKAVEVQDVLSVLRVLSNGRQDVALAAVLRSPFFEIAAKEDALALIRIAYPDEVFHRAAQRYAREREDELAIELRAVFAKLGDWRRMFREQSVGTSLRKLVEHNGFSTFCRARDDGAQRFANLNELLARGDAFDAFERQGLDRFLAFLNELETNDELGRPSLGAESDDVVRVMTVHKSKGLEYPIVVIPDLGKKFNVTSLNDPILLDRDLGIGMTALDLRKRIRYPSAASTVVRDHARRQAVAEEVRVLYVAMTRAREHLILVGSAKSEACCGWDEDWSDHQGALPDEAIQNAATALDWIGPIAALTNAAGLGTFRLVDHTAEPSGESPTARADGATVGVDSDPHAAEIVPTAAVDAPPITDPAALQAIARIEFEYPYKAASAQRATNTVTDFVSNDLPGVVRPGSAPTLPWPSAYRPTSRAPAVDVGTATHLVLQLLDFNRAADVNGVRAQLNALVEKKLLSERDASIVNLETIVWFAATELGHLLRRDDVQVYREQSLAIARPPPPSTKAVGATDRHDQVLVRGRIDVLVKHPGGLTLIDYKSDRVTRETLAAKAAAYSPQLWGYADAVRAIVGQDVVRVCLVFLSAREIRDVPRSRGEH